MTGLRLRRAILRSIYQHLISNSLLCLPPDLVNCCVPDCSFHREALDKYSSELVTCLVDSSFPVIPDLRGVLWLVGIMVLDNLGLRLIFGIECGCGWMLDVLQVAFCSISKGKLSLGLNMQ